MRHGKSGRSHARNTRRPKRSDTRIAPEAFSRNNSRMQVMTSGAASAACMNRVRWCNAVRRCELWTKERKGLGRLRRSRSHCRVSLSNPQQRRTAMKYFCGLDVSLNSTSICIVNQDGDIIRETQVQTDPADIDYWLKKLNLPMAVSGLKPVLSRPGCVMSCWPWATPPFASRPGMPRRRCRRSR
jgi:hypothetical protein